MNTPPTAPGWGAQPPPIQHQRLKEPKPFYRKVWFWVLIGVLAFMGGCTALVVGSVGTALNEPSTGATNEEGISRGAGSKDATGDVRLGAIAPPDAIGIRYGTVNITNHSSGTSDYYIEMRVLDADGTNIGMTNATADRVKPGQKATAKFMIAEEGAARVEVTEVSRTASLQ